MSRCSKEELLGPVLRDVSRSFYLTLRILPLPVRDPIGVAYLLARAADTLSDTEILPVADRLESLVRFRQFIQGEKQGLEMFREWWESLESRLVQGGGSKGERRLVEVLPRVMEVYRDCSLSDQRLIGEVLSELTHGMELDLKRFSRDNGMKALNSFEELEEYTYDVAGCVGAFWTRICVEHLREFRHWNVAEMSKLGVRFGKALQWTNVLRDIPADLRMGRCYLPASELARRGLCPEDLLQRESFDKLRPLYRFYVHHVLAHYQAAWEYVRAIPKVSFRLRLACVWPIWIGLETLAILSDRVNPLDGSRRHRVTRKQVYSILFQSLVGMAFPSFLDRGFCRRVQLINQHLSMKSLPASHGLMSNYSDNLIEKT